MDIAQLINDAMAEKRLNQPQLSARSGVPQATISRTLKGKSIPSTDTLVKLFSALEIPLSLIEGQEDAADRVSETPSAYNIARSVPVLPPAVTIDLDPDCLVVWGQLQQLPDREREEWRARLDIAAASARLTKLGFSLPDKPVPTTPPPKTTQPA